MVEVEGVPLQVDNFTAAQAVESGQEESQFDPPFAVLGSPANDTFVVSLDRTKLQVNPRLNC